MTATAAIYSKSHPLNRAQFTVAVQAYARRHGYYAATVRTMTVLRLAAVAEYMRRKS